MAARLWPALGARRGQRCRATPHGGGVAACDTASGMVLVGHAQRQRQPLTRQQRWAVLLVAAAIAVGAAVVIATAGSGPISANGCVNVTVPSATGAITLHQCGADARSWCRAQFAEHGTFAQLIQAQCRLAGFRPQRS
jgi:hypothetical protein